MLGGAKPSLSYLLSSLRSQVRVQRKWQTEIQCSEHTTERARSASCRTRCVSSFLRMCFWELRGPPEVRRGSMTRIAGLALAAVFASVLTFTTSTHAADLVIASYRGPQATIVLASNAGPWEQRAATDLQKYIRLMSGAEPAIVSVAPEAAIPALYVGQAALA